MSRPVPRTRSVLVSAVLRRSALSLAVTTTVLVSACSSDGGAGGASTPRVGGTLTFAVSSDAGCVDPQQESSGDTVLALRQTVDSLTDQDPTSGKIVPWLARAWEVSPDARTFTFHLRPGVTFSDGAPVDARAVKANFDAIPRLGELAIQAEGYLSGYAGTTVVDDLTARVAFTQPNVQFLQATSTSVLGLVAPSSAAKSAQQRCRGIVGSGPFVLHTYSQNQSIELTRRAGYAWGSSRWTKPGEAYLQRLVFRVVPESGVRTGSLRSGQVDAIGRIGRAEEAALTGTDVRLLTYTIPGVGYTLGFNNSRPLLTDAAVRRAIMTGVDRQQIVDTVFPKGTPPATSILAKSTPGYVDLSSDLRFDPAAAKAALDRDGWRAGSDGIRQKNGTRLRLSGVWFANAAIYRPAVELIQQQLRAIGVDLALRELQVAQFPQVLKSGDFDVLWGGNYNRADPDALRTLFSSRLVNAYRLPPGDLDQVLATQAGETNETRRTAEVGQAQRLIVRNAYVVPVVDQQTEIGVSAKVHDTRFGTAGDVQLHDAWVG
ncbi:ABC transporter substrate-binding protein [Frankia sp. AgB32]|uniref:ABC transporter substrate-binding protein n=1 Tax=Frankia sp. AgB32 TaxID=631119 RepID=UPI0020100DA2|nr:ABC transporter substrate-binding protein [Frankia sp. AgB32]MCK9897894.1 ABC transporter substrate-binding protein [Frankia sp. AgB32]